jgi:hypothetical protein
VKLTVETAPIASLTPYPGNARLSDMATLKESLTALGQYKPIVVNTGTQTGRPDEILAGHHLVLAATELGWSDVQITRVDVDADTARRINLVDNRSSDLGGYDTEALYALLAELPDLAGTGYSDDDLDDMRVMLEQKITIPQPEPGDDALDLPREPRKFDPADPWKNPDRRLMVLDVPVPLYVWLQDAMARIATAKGLESNLEVLTVLVEAEVGEEAPAAVPVPEEVA